MAKKFLLSCMLVQILLSLSVLIDTVTNVETNEYPPAGSFANRHYQMYYAVSFFNTVFGIIIVTGNKPLYIYRIFNISSLIFAYVAVPLTYLEFSTNILGLKEVSNAFSYTRLIVSFLSSLMVFSSKLPEIQKIKPYQFILLIVPLMAIVSLTALVLITPEEVYSVIKFSLTILISIFTTVRMALTAKGKDFVIMRSPKPTHQFVNGATAYNSAQNTVSHI